MASLFKANAPGPMFTLGDEDDETLEDESSIPAAIDNLKVASTSNEASHGDDLPSRSQHAAQDEPNRHSTHSLDVATVDGVSVTLRDVPSASVSEADLIPANGTKKTNKDDSHRANSQSAGHEKGIPEVENRLARIADQRAMDARVEDIEHTSAASPQRAQERPAGKLDAAQTSGDIAAVPGSSSVSESLEDHPRPSHVEGVTESSPQTESAADNEQRIAQVRASN
jgi:hypothetical protein